MYELEIIRRFAAFDVEMPITYSCQTIDEVEQRIKGLKSFEFIESVREYRLIYEHHIKSPPADYCSLVYPAKKYHCYLAEPKIDKNEIVPAKKKDYTHKLLSGERWQNYVIKYDCPHTFPDALRDELSGIPFYIMNTSSYDARDSVAVALSMMYRLSKSNSVFNLKLYQYRYLDVATYQNKIKGE